MTKVFIPKTGDAQITITAPVEALREHYLKCDKLPHPKVLIKKDYVRGVIGRALENVKLATKSLDHEVHPGIEYEIED